MTGNQAKPVARVGFRLAQLSALLHVVGGTTDLAMRELLPFHEEFLGYPHGAVPQATADLVLALLHALGGCLVVGGIAMWVLLGLMRSQQRTTLGLAVVLLAAGLEGSVGVRMLQLGLRFGYIPLGVAALAALGIALWYASAGRAPLKT